MKINIFEYIVMRKMIFSSDKPPQERPHFYDRYITVNKILNRNRFGEGNDTNQGRRVFLFD
jgi:hypothetical protein